MKHRVFLTCLCAVLGLNTVWAQDYVIGPISVADPMTYATPKRAMSGAGYFTITNNGESDDRLIGVSAAFAKVSLHGSQETEGVMRMIELEAVDVPAGEVVVFAPGGMHVMFMGLNGDPFEVGERIPATLIFETAGAIDVEFTVRQRGKPG